MADQLQGLGRWLLHQLWNSLLQHTLAEASQAPGPHSQAAPWSSAKTPAAVPAPAPAPSEAPLASRTASKTVTFAVEEEASESGTEDEEDAKKGKGHDDDEEQDEQEEEKHAADGVFGSLSRSSSTSTKSDTVAEPALVSDPVMQLLSQLGDGVVGRKQELQELQAAIARVSSRAPPAADNLHSRAGGPSNRGKAGSALLADGDAVAQASSAASWGRSRPLIVVQGPAGVGKTALLARTALQHARAWGVHTVLAHFYGSRDLRQLLLAWIQRLAAGFALLPLLPSDVENLPLATLLPLFNKLLQAATESLPAPAFLLLVLDSADTFDASATELHSAAGPTGGSGTGTAAGRAAGARGQSYILTQLLELLPPLLPAGVAMVLSVRQLPTAVLHAQRSTSRGPHQVPAPMVVTLKGLAMVDRAALTRAVLARYRKRLAESTFDNQLADLIGKRGAADPLFLSVACQELRLAAGFENLSQRIRQLPSTLGELFQAVIGRLENDVGRSVVAQTLCLLLHAPGGLSEDDLASLLSNVRWRRHAAAQRLLAESTLPRSQAAVLALWSQPASHLQVAQLLRQLAPLLQPATQVLASLAVAEAASNATDGASLGNEQGPALRLRLEVPEFRAMVQQRYGGKAATGGATDSLALTMHRIMAAWYCARSDPSASDDYANADAESLCQTLHHLLALGADGADLLIAKCRSLSFLAAVGRAGDGCLSLVVGQLQKAAAMQSFWSLGNRSDQPVSLTEAVNESLQLLTRHRRQLVAAPHAILQIAVNHGFAAWPGLRHQAESLLLQSGIGSWAETNSTSVSAGVTEGTVAATAELLLKRKPAAARSLAAETGDMKKVKSLVRKSGLAAAAQAGVSAASSRAFTRHNSPPAAGGSSNGRQHAGLQLARSAELLPTVQSTLALPAKATALNYCQHASILAVGLATGTILILEAHSQRSLASLQGHVAAVTSLAFAAQSRGNNAERRDDVILYSTAADDTALIWDVRNKRRLATCTGHSKRISACAASWDDDGEMVTAGWDTEVLLYRQRSNKTRASLFPNKSEGPQGPVSAVAFSEAKPWWLAVGSWDCTVYVVDTTTKELVAALKGHAASVQAVAWGRQPPHLLASMDLDGWVVLWSVAAKHQIMAFLAHGGPGTSMVAHGNVLATASPAGVVRVWQCMPGAEVSTWLPAPVGALSDRAAEGDRPVDKPRSSGARKPGLATTALPLPAASSALLPENPIHRLLTLWTEESEFVVSGDHQGSVAIIRRAAAELAAGELPGHCTGVTFKAHGMAVLALTAHVTSTGHMLVASAAADGDATLWRVSLSDFRVHQLATLSGFEGALQTLAIRTNTDHLQLVGGGDDMSLHVWEADAGVGDAAACMMRLQHCTFKAHEQTMTAVVYSLDGQWCFTCGRDGLLCAWDASNFSQLLRIPAAHADWINGMSVGSVGGQEYLATVGNDGVCRVWLARPTRGGTSVALSLCHCLSGHEAAPVSVALMRAAPDNVPSLATSAADGTVRLWAANSGAACSVLRMSGPGTACLALAWRCAPYLSHARLLVGDVLGRVRIVAPFAPRLLAERHLGHGAVTGLAVGPSSAGAPNVSGKAITAGSAALWLTCSDNSLHELEMSQLLLEAEVPNLPPPHAGASLRDAAPPLSMIYASEPPPAAQGSPVAPRHVDYGLWQGWASRGLQLPMTGARVFLPTLVTAVGLSSQHVCVCLQRKVAIMTIDVATGELRETDWLPAPVPVPLTCMVAAPSHGYVAFGGWSSYVAVANVTHLAEVEVLPTGPHDRWVAGLSFGPSGEHLAVAYQEGVVEIWALQTMKKVSGSVPVTVPECGLQECWITAVAWTAQGLFVGCSDGRIVGWPLPTVSLDVEVSQAAAPLPLLASKPTVWSAHGEGAAPQSTATHTAVRALAGLPHGLVSTGQDGQVRLWFVKVSGGRMSSVKLVASEHCGAPGCSLAVSGSKVFCGDTEGRLHVFERRQLTDKLAASVGSLMEDMTLEMLEE